jgi:GR25 family glycosyltransferase involved in LPS biosynthesis
MKTYIIYNKQNIKSEENANLCLSSFKNFPSWSPELFDGCTPKDLEYLDKKYNLKNDRARYKPEDLLYKSKKSCFYSHFQLWLNCIEMNTPIAIVEHDTYCSGDLPANFHFDSIVQFSAESIFNAFDRYIEAVQIYKQLSPGLHSMTIIPPLRTKKKWGHCIAGNTAYGITPAAARILVEDCFTHGWEQNDLLMNVKLCKIEMLVPSIIVYDCSRELQSSSAVVD